MVAKLIFAGAAAVLCTAGGAFATTYDVTTLDAPGSEVTEAYGINGSGAVTGYYTGPAGRGSASSIPAEPTPRLSTRAQADQA